MKRQINYHITNKFHNYSILQFLKENHFCHQTIVYCKQTPNGVLLNNQWVHMHEQIKENDQLTIQWEEPWKPSSILPVAGILDIIYEDEDILVLNKDKDTPIHPSMGNHENTLANYVLDYYQKKGILFTYRCMNRLDRDTTGLTIIAKNCQSAGRLSQAVSNRMVHRTYLAICKGMVQEKGTIHAPIGRKDDSTIERCIDYEKGETAITHYKRLDYNPVQDISLIALSLETGRTHQIRVHMKSIGHPLIGDFLYYPENKQMNRQALHSYCLEFIHPLTEEPMKLFAPLPEDMKCLFPTSEIATLISQISF